MRGRAGRVVALCVAAILGMTASVLAMTIEVTISDLSFSPQEVKAGVGDTIEWRNHDIVAHTATAKGRWDVTIPANGTGRVVLKKAGKAKYYCRFHPNMTAGITIAARAGR